MNKLFSKAIITACITSSLYAYAGEPKDNAPDPADVTRVLTSLRVSVGTNSNDNDIVGETELKIGGSFNKDNNFLTLFEVQAAEKDRDPYEDGFDVRQIRGRWFQVFGTALSNIPKVGYSVDVIDRSNDDSESVDNIYALGGIIKVPVLDNWVMYPNIAAVQANLKDEYKSAMQGSDDGKGFQLNLYNSIYLSKSGTYLMISPQYSYLDFDSFTTQDLQLETIFGMPLTDNKRFWFVAKYSETFSDIDSDTPSVTNMSFKANDDKRQFRVGVTYIF
jgi:hypothetical protein